MRALLHLLVGLCLVSAATKCERHFSLLTADLQNSLKSRPRPYDAASLMDDAQIQATHIMDWLKQILREAGEPDDVSLFFAFYTDSTDSKVPCESASSGPFVTGGGSALCDMVARQSSLKGLGTFMDQMLLMKSGSDWDTTQKLVTALGYAGYSQFKGATNTNYVYIPSNKHGVSSSTKWSVQELQAQQSKYPYYGVSAGGGGGMGWSISCADKGKPSSGSVLLTGGGGGGGGMSSPYHTVPTRAGGGGGGGAQAATGRGLAGAGAGTPGRVDPNPKNQIDDFIHSVHSAKDTVLDCLKDKNKRIQLRGGGGGGGGFEVFQPWNVTDRNASPEEYSPHAVSFGWGVQFSVGQTNELGDGKLYPGVASNGDTYALCPTIGGSDAALNGTAQGAFDCSDDCFLSSSEVSGGSQQVNQVFACAPRVSAQICRRATTQENPSLRYGKYASYQACNAPLVASYLETLLPKVSSFSYTPYPGYSVPGADPLPQISPSWVSANKAKFCEAPPAGCPPHPAC